MAADSKKVLMLDHMLIIECVRFRGTQLLSRPSLPLVTCFPYFQSTTIILPVTFSKSSPQTPPDSLNALEVIHALLIIVGYSEIGVA